MRDEDLREIEAIVDDPEKYAAILAVLRRVQQREKQKTHARQAEGIAAAKERGVQFGRPPLKIPANFPQVYESHKNGTITGLFAAELLKVSPKTYRKLMQRYEEQLAEREARK